MGATILKLVTSRFTSRDRPSKTRHLLLEDVLFVKENIIIYEHIFDIFKYLF